MSILKTIHSPADLKRLVRRQRDDIREAHARMRALEAACQKLNGAAPSGAPE